jgi:hypothetical protein
MERVDSGESKVDITEEELLTRYVEPYIFGETIVINGTTIDPTHNNVYKSRRQCLVINY